MKLVQFLGTTTVLTLSMTSIVLAGGVAGGGGPPSKQTLDQILKKNPGKAALILWDTHTLGLLVDHPLAPELTLARAATYPDAIPLSADDYNQIASKPDPIKAINRDGEMRSYRVLDGAEEGTLQLIDRRLFMRAGLLPQP